MLPRVVFELRRFGRLVFAGFLVGLLDQRGEREGLLRNQRVAGQEPHLIDQARDALDAVGQRHVERGAESGVFPFVREQLLVGGERHHGVADFMGQAIGHGL